MKWKIIIFIELVLIVAIGAYVFNHYYVKKDVLATSTQPTSPIDRNDLKFPSIGVLKYYYEYEPNSIVNDKPDWLTYSARYSINKEGLNNIKDFSFDKPDDVFRIVTIGDSFTFGMYVDTKDNYPSKLDDLLSSKTCGKYSKFEILNLGMGGYDIQYAIERYILHGKKYNPDLVLWLINSHNLKQIRELLTPLQEKVKSDEIDLGKLSNDPLFDKLVATEATKVLNKTYSEKYILSLQKQFLENFSNDYQGPLAIFMFTSAEKELKSFIDEYSKTRSNTYFFGNITDLDKSHTLADGHPNTSGYDLIVNDIYNNLIFSDLMSCK